MVRRCQIFGLGILLLLLLLLAERGRGAHKSGREVAQPCVREVKAFAECKIIIVGIEILEEIF